MPTTLKFYVKEDDRDFPVCHMTEPEGAAIGECVDDLCPNAWGTEYWFESDTCLLDEGEEDDDGEYQEPTYGLLRCFIHNPKPRNGSMMESRLPHPIPDTLLRKLAGKTFVVHPRQLGLNPWGKKVEVLFEAVEAPAPVPVPPVPLPNPEPAPAPAPVPAPAPAPPKPAAKAGIPVSVLIAAALKAQ
jgi:hypothetical protein